MLYACDSTNGCSQTVGYAKIKTYTVISSKPSDWSDNTTPSYKNSYLKDTTNGITYTSQSDVENAPDFANNKFFTLNESAFYKITTSGGTDADSTNCNANNIGKFSTDNGVCLGATIYGPIIASGTFENFLLTGSGDIFPQISTGKGIILTQAANLIYHNNAPNGIFFFFIILLININLMR